MQPDPPILVVATESGQFVIQVTFNFSQHPCRVPVKFALSVHL
jgi:hypothetical protein